MTVPTWTLAELSSAKPRKLMFDFGDRLGFPLN